VADQAPNIWELSDLCTPWCVHVVATLRVAEHIEAGHTAINDLANAAQCDAYCLQAVLRHLISKGLFAEPTAGKFALNESARGLLDPGMRLGLDLESLGGRMAHSWSTLLTYVRTGASAYHERFGLPFWKDLDAHPQIAADFDALIGPSGHGMPDPYFEITDGWDSVRAVVDVGGGTGAMLAEVLRVRPTINGILVDLPRTVVRSSEIFAQAGVIDRAKVVGQSFFQPLPSGADLYLLRGIINDWPDKEAIEILARCAEAARPAGRVVVLKGISSDDTPRGITIEMVLAGGKQRTLSEFRELAQTAGLEIVSAGQQKSYYVVECRPM
jgi:2,7-dihydroxy-5-methyl-1-naphthoate 7-O-methyltransferase